MGGHSRGPFVGLAALMLAACSSPQDSAPDAAAAVASDADACAAEPPAFVWPCEDGGLAGAIDGMWTLTGHKVTKIYGAAPDETDEPVTGSMTIDRAGTGWCQFDLDGGTLLPTPLSLEPWTYVDDNHVMTPWHRFENYKYSVTYLICRRSEDGALYYRYEDTGYRLNDQYMTLIEGVLTR